jgi:hypothetical protein
MTSNDSDRESSRESGEEDEVDEVEEGEEVKDEDEVEDGEDGGSEEESPPPKSKMTQLLETLKALNEKISKMPKPTPQESKVGSPQGKRTPQGKKKASQKKNRPQGKTPPPQASTSASDIQGSKSAVDEFLTNVDDSEDEEGGEWFEELAGQFKESDATGAPLPEKLAGLLTSMVESKMAIPAQNTLLAEVKTPANAPLIANPRVNTDVWTNLSVSTKQKDLRLALVGEKIAKSMVKQAEVAAGLTKLRTQLAGENKAAVQTLAKTTIEGFQLGAMALQEINQRRRDGMRFDMQGDYKTLCNAPDKETETLFGKKEQLAEKVTSIEKVKNISKITVKSSFLGRGRQRPYENRNPRQESKQYKPSNMQRPPWNPSTGTSYSPHFRGRSSRGNRGRSGRGHRH